MSENEKCAESHMEPLFTVMDDIVATEIRLREQSSDLYGFEMWGPWGCSHCHHHVEQMGGDIVECWLRRPEIEQHLKDA